MLVPKKRFKEKRIIETKVILRLKELVESYTISEKPVWTDRYYPITTKFLSEQEIDFSRTSQKISFSPRENKQVSTKIDGKWFKLELDADGCFIGHIGMDNSKDPLGPEVIASAFFAVTNFFSKKEFQEQFSDLLWMGECRLMYRARVFQEPLDSLVVNFKTSKLPVMSNLEYQNCMEGISLSTIDASQLAKQMVSIFLADNGCWEFEETLFQLNLYDNLY